MNDFIVKICGITELSIARFLVQNNIDLIGFIFHPKSPRYILPEKAKYILDKLGNKRKKIKLVGVFVNQGIRKVISIAETLSLDFIQLHGKETPEYIDKLSDFSVIKAFRISDDFTKKEIAKYKSKNIKYYLMDTFQKDKAGGTGKTFDWKSSAFLKNMSKIIISGGLKRDNIEQAIDFFHPAGIDLNSGVEKSPGIKSQENIKDILNLIRSDKTEIY